VKLVLWNGRRIRYASKQACGDRFRTDASAPRNSIVVCLIHRTPDLPVFRVWVEHSRGTPERRVRLMVDKVTPWPGTGSAEIGRLNDDE